MRITLRLTLSLVLLVSMVVLGFSLFQSYQERERIENDLDRRAWLEAEELSGEITPPIHAWVDLNPLAGKFRHRDRFAGIALYGSRGELLCASAGVPGGSLHAVPPLVQEAARTRGAVDGDLAGDGPRIRAHVHPMVLDDGRLKGALVVLQDASHVEEHVAHVWKRNGLRLLIQTVLIALATLLIVRWTVVRPMRRLAGWIRDLRAGRIAGPPVSPTGDVFKPLADEITSLARSYHAARAAAAEEARLRESAASTWTAERLKEHCRARLQGHPFIVVSNREPYVHLREGKSIRWQVPASGLVTALEPILRACGGTWVAQASGNADHEVVDDRGRISVPPDDPQYALRRVWLSKEEEEGYYYGFSNEGLWPLCHIAHTRPLFRPADWAHYRQVNERFCEAVVEEIGDAPAPCVLIQDYHFALLPRLVKNRRPDARVAIFWHIPWPNPEAFGICPWQGEILHGMLGADLIGFHTPFHCNNFLATVDRALEARIDWDHSAVYRQSQVSHVKPFPISVDFTGGPAEPAEAAAAERERIFREIGFSARHLGVGVDRLDYTKGIPERFQAIERFLEKHPRYQGEFTFVEIGAPSRTHITRYNDLGREVENEARRINERFRIKGSPWQPIVLVARHHSHAEILPYYRASNFCLVTSLHDGMNLVAKEFIAARADEGGVLILSRFAGAAGELKDAMVVNPYDMDQTAEAIRAALEMPPEERQARMQRLRGSLRERNVYRWAAELLGELAQLRLDRHRPGAAGVSAGEPVTATH